MEVSLIITCYNQEKYISRAIRSCLNQNFPKGEFEVVVVDDSSSDYSVKIIKDFDKKITLIQNKKNKGLPYSRNIGIRKATGRYIVHIDGDDFILKDLIQIEYIHLNLNAHWGGVSCDYIMVDNDGLHQSRISGLSSPIACGIMFRKDYIIATGLYDEKMLANEDRDFRLRFMKNYHIGHIELPLYRYRKHQNNMTNNQKLMSKFDKKLIKKHKKKKK